MSLWRRTAIERFPHLHRVIADADGVGWVWFELRHTLEDMYRAAASGEKPLAVVLWFYEDLADNILLRPDMARWMSQEDFDLLEFAWRYVLKGEETVNTFKQEFAAKKAELSGKNSRRRQHLSMS